jgi:5-methylcytosine-specific restriction endonuclease McrA
MRVTTTCANCEKVIAKYPSQIKEQNFCSRACHVDYKNKTGFYTKENHPQWKGSTLKLPCKHCEQMFYIKKSAIERGLGRGTFCSRQCQKDHGSVLKECKSCGKEFRVKKSHDQLGNGIYCSRKCYNADYGIVYSGENNPNYKNAQCYTPEYDRRKQHERRAKKQSNGGTYTQKQWQDLCDKYGNKCLCCKRSDVALTVDHVIPIKKGGSNDISNLQPLCKSCNSKKHLKIIDYRDDENQQYCRPKTG